MDSGAVVIRSGLVRRCTDDGACYDRPTAMPQRSYGDRTVTHHCPGLRIPHLIGSHALLYHGLCDEVNYVPNERYVSLLERAKTTITPIEFCGDVGDVLFAHALLVHSGGINESPDVRIAVINDFQRLRPKGTLMWQVEGELCAFATTCRDALLTTRLRAAGAQTPHTANSEVVQPNGVVPFPAGERLQSAGDKRCKLIWHHDSIEFAPPSAPSEDMWKTWSFGAEPTTAESVVDDPEGPWWVKYKRPKQTPIMRLDEIASFDAEKQQWVLHPND